MESRGGQDQDLPRPVGGVKVHEQITTRNVVFYDTPCYKLQQHTRWYVSYRTSV